MKKECALFLFGCLGTRTLLCFLSAKYQSPWIAYLYTVAGVGILLHFLFKWGMTSMNGKRKWWHEMRPVHGVLWLTFAHQALLGNPDAWKFLAADLFLGVGTFLLFSGC